MFKQGTSLLHNIWFNANASRLNWPLFTEVIVLIRSGRITKIKISKERTKLLIYSPGLAWLRDTQP